MRIATDTTPNTSPMQSSAPVDALLVAHLPQLSAYAMVLTRNRASADDLLQETAYRVLRAQSQFTLGTNFTAWVYRILRNQFISSLRRSKRTPVPIDDLPESLLAKRADQEDIIFTQQVIRAMEKLHPEQREVLILVCAGGMSYDEAAEKIKCTIGTIKSRLWRARKHMEQLILEDSKKKTNFTCSRGDKQELPSEDWTMPARGQATTPHQAAV